MINDRPIETVHRLQKAFGKSNVCYDTRFDRVVPMGIEIEVSFRSYFPDLFVPGFPNIAQEQLDAISKEASRREAILIPKLEKTVECGINKGNDKYWEFSFDPITNVTLLMSQIQILADNGLIPTGKHSLHITYGGLRVTRDVYFLALILESFCCDRARIMKGFHPDHQTYLHAWSKKGRAGIYQKRAHDLIHDFELGAEIRTLQTPESLLCLSDMLAIGHYYADVVLAKQQGQQVDRWNRLVDDMTSVLQSFGLPNSNWEQPYQQRDIWTKFADEFEAIKSQILQLVSNDINERSN